MPEINVLESDGQNLLKDIEDLFYLKNFFFVIKFKDKKFSLKKNSVTDKKYKKKICRKIFSWCTKNFS